MESTLTQDDFSGFVNNYNADYVYLLTRASRGHYDCLVASFRVLKDLYDVILKLHDASQVEFQVVPYPLSFRGNEELLIGFGFDREQIENIYTFLDFVKQTQGRDFEECIEETLPVRCAR